MGARRRCCCPGCATLVDLFDREDSTSLGANWQECDGDWDVWDGHLRVDETDAIVSLVGATMGTAPDGNPVGILSAYLHLFKPAEPPPGDAGFSSVGAIYRILAFYGSAVDGCADVSYWLLELEVVNTGTGELRLYDPSSVLVGTRALAFTDQWTDFTLCISDNMITGYSTDLIGGPLIWTTHGDLLDGIHFAVGCGNTNPVYYESISYSDQFDHDSTCPDCAEPCCCPNLESEDHQPDLIATIDASGCLMDGETVTLECSALPGECCVWLSTGDFEFSCSGADDGGLTYKINISLQCVSDGCEGYRIFLDWPTGSTNWHWCDGTGSTTAAPNPPETYDVNEPCSCDPISLTFGPFSLTKAGAQLPGQDYCVCCDEFYIVITEAP